MTPRLLLLASLLSFAQTSHPPQARISNGLITATLYLPDPERGYYRGTRFDWSGVISSLKYKGHEYFGVWFDQYDPHRNDAITGPVEEFGGDEPGMGYDEAPPGGAFVRIGVGVVRKPEERSYRRFETYDIIDHGRWKVEPAADQVTFTHTLDETKGYAYVYRKVVRLAKGRPELAIEHSLLNTGRRTIDTVQYNHNFFVIDGQPAGPHFAVRFPFDLKPKREFRGPATVHGGQLIYQRELAKGESVFNEFDGFGASAKDYDIRVENVQSRAGVRITGDQPLVKLIFWSIRTTVCPEPYIRILVKPGEEMKWNLRYEFYQLE